MRSIRWGFAVLFVVGALTRPGSLVGRDAWAAGAREEAVSTLRALRVATKQKTIVVSLIGSRAADFSSFAMTNPSRVVIDWAGSRVADTVEPMAFIRGPIRRITAGQLDSEAETVSRVVIELTQETPYHVIARGSEVRIRFDVPSGTVVERAPSPVSKALAGGDRSTRSPAPVLAMVDPRGPLTEPEARIPRAVPRLPERPLPPPVEVAPTPVPPSLPAAFMRPARPSPVKKPPPEPVKAAEPALVAAKPEPVNAAEPALVAAKPEPVKAAEPALVAAKPEPVKAVQPALVAAKPEPVKAVEPALVVAKPEPVKAVEPALVVAKPEPVKAVEPALVAAKPEPVKAAEPALVVAKPEPVKAVEPALVVAKPEPVKAVEPALVVAKPEPVKAARKPLVVAKPEPVKAVEPALVVAKPEPVKVARKPLVVAKPEPVKAVEPALVVAKPEPVKAARKPLVVAKPEPVKAVEPALVVAKPEPVKAARKPLVVAKPEPVKAVEPALVVAKPEPVKAVEPALVVAKPEPVKAVEPALVVAKPEPVKAVVVARSDVAPVGRPAPVVATTVKVRPAAEEPATVRVPAGSSGGRKTLAAFVPQAPAKASAEAAVQAPPRSTTPRLLTYIGFQQMGGVSRVFARFDERPRHRTEGPVDGRLVVELLSTRVNVKNNTRPLDTTYFDSPVKRIQAIPGEDDTRIVIQLRETADWKLKWIGTTLAIDFTRER
ncbi:MAG: AMIN domain-containing protein [Deltaproteobacteria bacterium]|nr:AMIN domain-containing protein [Deltaproteobacteria bacterium]